MKPTTKPTTAPDDDARWLQNALSELDAQQQSIDYVTRSKLSAARARALDSPPQRQWFARPAIATAMLLVVCSAVYFNYPQQPPAQSVPLMASQDLPILSSSEDLEFYQSLEFLEWMDANYPQTGQERSG